MKIKTLLLALLLVLSSCAAPPQIIDLSQKSQDSVVAYQQNMTTIVMATTKAYKEAERRRHMADYNYKLSEMAAKGEGKISANYAKVMALILIRKLDEINDQVRGVEDALVEANIDMDRYLEMQKVIYEYLKQSGLQPEHLAEARAALTTAADDFIELKRRQNMIKLQAAIRKLEGDLANPELEDKGPTLEELEKKREALELLKSVGGGTTEGDDQ